MARRPVRESSRPRGRVAKKSNPLPLILGGVGLLVVVVVIAMLATKGGDDDKGGDTPPDPTPVAKSNGTPSTSTPTAKLYDGKTFKEWAELRKKVDMSNWDEGERTMSQALIKLDEAETIRKGGDEKGFLTKVKDALKDYRKAGNLFTDFIEVDVQGVDEQLWYTSANVFKKESEQMARWDKRFRGYIQFENK
ncbi:MAG: hypothetical protein R3F20_11465 [Planctomycetota bacterium]